MPASRVASSAVSAQFASGSGTLACPINVTAGDCLPIVYVGYVTGTAVVPTITKSSGTATIGTPRLDGSVAAAIGVQLITCVFMVPITGSGTLTLQFTSANGIFTVGWDEITGLDAIPVLDVAWTNSGNGTTYSTGAHAVAGAGIIVAGYADGTGANAIYSAYSDTPVWEQTNAANATGLEQEKIVSGAGSHTLTVSVDTAWPWQAVAVSYLAPGGAPPTYDPWLMADGVTSWLMADGVTDWVGALSTASGSNSFSCVGSGGGSFAGTAPSQLIRIAPTPTGGITSGGTAPSPHKRVTVPTGGLTSAGTAAAVFARSFTYVPTGGLSSGGAGVSLRRRSMSGTGGLVAAGAAALRLTAIVVATGGILAAGTSPSLKKRVVATSGGVQSAGAATTFLRRTVTPTGGITTGGTAVTLRSRTVVPTGGIVAAGSGVSLRTRTVVPTGGLVTGGTGIHRSSHRVIPTGGGVFGGTAPVTKIGGASSFPYTGTGGGNYAGTAPVRFTKVSLPTGGLLSGGTAPSRRTRTVIPSGGVIASGVATTSRKRITIATGGGVFGGTAPSSRTGGAQNYPYTGTGGASFGGTAPSSRKVAARIPTGGLVTAGVAVTVRRRTVTPTGGLLASGTVKLVRRQAYTGTGSLVSGGLAQTNFVPGVPPATYISAATSATEVTVAGSRSKLEPAPSISDLVLSPSESVLKMSTHSMVEGDTLPPLITTLSWPASVSAVHPDLTDAQTVTFHMERISDSVVMLNDVPAAFLDRVQRIVKYQWLAGNARGQYRGKFRVTFNNGDKLTVPTRNYLTINVETP